MKMTRTNAPKKLTLRRLATFTAAIGMLVASSGVALMVTASPANAATKVGICHATSSDSNPYVYISVDDDSVKYQAHLAHRNTPNKTWKNAGTFNGIPHAAGAPKADLINGLDGVIDSADDCDADVVVLEAVADVEFLDATCAFPTRAEYDTTGSNVTFSILSGAATPGSAIVVRATATNGATFEGGGTTQDFPHNFPAEVDPNAPPCVIVNPPDLAVATVNFVDPTCANLNDASYTTDGDNVDFSVKSGSDEPGEEIVITATATGNATFAGGDTEKDFTHTFGDEVNLNAEPCVDVEPPIVVPPVGIPTVVHSGIVSTEDFRGEQGLVLFATGMALMVLAGGLGLGAARRARI